MGIRLCILR